MTSPSNHSEPRQNPDLRLGEPYFFDMMSRDHRWAVNRDNAMQMSIGPGGWDDNASQYIASAPPFPESDLWSHNFIPADNPVRTLEEPW